MGNIAGKEPRKNDIEQQVLVKSQPVGGFSGYLYSIWGHITRNFGDKSQPVTQQSNDEVHVNLIKEEDPIDNAATDESITQMKAAENEKAENQKITNGQEELHLKIISLEHQLKEVKKEKQMLLTRLSEISSMQLTEGNPNIVDLSDPNRPDKVAEQFSELYDNHWTDSFYVLNEVRGQQEEAVITVLLKIILRVYEVCRCHAENQNSQIIKAMCVFTGVSDGESIIRESMHNLRNFRVKHFSAAMKDIEKMHNPIVKPSIKTTHAIYTTLEASAIVLSVNIDSQYLLSPALTVALIFTIIEESLPSMIGSDVYIDCQEYIAECTKVCWLMCIKSPPMYISAGKTNKFDHNLYTSYTKTGKHASYVVWPTLFQYENGPIMKKGVAQGTN